MPELGTLTYWGDIQLIPKSLYLGNEEVYLNTFTQTTASIITSGSRFYFDANQWSGTGNLLSSFGSIPATSSLYGNVTKITSPNGGAVMNIDTSSILIVSGSSIGAAVTGVNGETLILIAASSGSSTSQHGRILNSDDNWLFGTYGGNAISGDTENQVAWYNGSFIINSGSYDTNFRMYVGLIYSATSQSIYVNNQYLTGQSGANRISYNGLYVNKGDFTPQGSPSNTPGEITQCEVGLIASYDRILSNEELTLLYNYYALSYGL